MIRVALCAVLLFGVSPAVLAAGLDCKKAQTRIEKMICADAAAQELDEHLGRYYSAARAAMPEGAACLQADQVQWLATVREPCQDGSCLKTAYLSRLSELDALQPGATAIRHIDLPPTPALVWIIPPAEDRVAAPLKLIATPLEVTGTIVDDIAANPDSEGIVLQTPDGTRYPLVLLMFLEASTQQQLASLAGDRGVTYRARGHAAMNDSGRPYFEPSRCVFVHRLPKATP
jgi:uncharacterized protein